MERFTPTIEDEPTPKDISQEFLTMKFEDFLPFLRTQMNEPFLSIAIDWVDVMTARRLKAFLESSDRGQERSATIRATEEQKSLAPNEFSSGIKWEKVD